MFKLNDKVKCFRGGQLSLHLKDWKELTSDKKILEIIKGDIIEFENVPIVRHNAKNASFTEEENEYVKSEILKLLSKSVIIETHHENTEYVSPIFIVPKADGGTRLILNLKGLNTFIKYHHFKMATIKTILALITKHCFLASIDLKDAYYKTILYAY